MIARIEAGYEVFVSDGDVAFGAVRHAPSEGDGDVVIYVENAGEFRVPLSAVEDVHAGKVILIRGKLNQDLQRAIRHAHDGEHEDG